MGHEAKLERKAKRGWIEGLKASSTRLGMTLPADSEFARGGGCVLPGAHTVRRYACSVQYGPVPMRAPLLSPALAFLIEYHNVKSCAAIAFIATIPSQFRVHGVNRCPNWHHGFRCFRSEIMTALARGPGHRKSRGFVYLPSLPHPASSEPQR